MSFADPTLQTGPLLLGHLLNTFLFGVELVQFHRYRAKFPDELTWTRWLLHCVVLLDTIQTVFAIYNAWRILGSGWGSTDRIVDPDWSWGTIPLFTGLVSLMVQGFYAMRITKLIKSRATKWIVTVIMIVAATQAASGVFAGVYYGLGSFINKKNTIPIVTTLWLGGSALCDLMITMTIVTFLFIQVAGFSSADNVVMKVITMTIETGAITTGTAVADLILFLVFPGNRLHLLFCIPLAKLYSNTLLAMLNARKGAFMDKGASSGFVLSLPVAAHDSPVDCHPYRKRADSSATLLHSPSGTHFIDIPDHSTSPYRIPAYPSPTMTKRAYATPPSPTTDILSQRRGSEVSPIFTSGHVKQGFAQQLTTARAPPSSVPAHGWREQLELYRISQGDENLSSSTPPRTCIQDRRRNVF